MLNDNGIWGAFVKKLKNSYTYEFLTFSSKFINGLQVNVLTQPVKISGRYLKD